MDPTRELIKLVRQHPCIWDKRCHEYREKKAKYSAWEEIYKKMEPEYSSMQVEARLQIGSQMTKKWYNIRDSYVKSKRNTAINRKPYIYAYLLKFLDPVLVDDKTKANAIEMCEVTEDKQSVDEEENNSESYWINDTYFEFEGNEDETLSNIAKRRHEEATKERDATQMDTEESIVSVLANLIQKEEDEDRAFFKSITPSVKRLSDSSKLEFRIEVMKLLKTLSYRDKKRITLKRERESNESNDSDL